MLLLLIAIVRYTYICRCKYNWSTSFITICCPINRRRAVQIMDDDDPIDSSASNNLLVMISSWFQRNQVYVGTWRRIERLMYNGGPELWEMERSRSVKGTTSIASQKGTHCFHYNSPSFVLTVVVVVVVVIKIGWWTLLRTRHPHPRWRTVCLG